MRVEVLDSIGAVAERAAAVVAGYVERNPTAAIGWPTGATVVPLYASLAERVARGALDLSRTRGINLDELLIPTDDERSFASYMRRHAAEKIGLKADRCDIPRAGVDPSAECSRYDSAIEAVGGLGLAILGVGVDGHVAYNLPGPRVGPTHVVELDDAVADTLGIAAGERPLRAITLGMDALEGAESVLILATGEAKREAVRALVEGGSSSEWPCARLREHRHLTVLLDEMAASGVAR